MACSLWVEEGGKVAVLNEDGSVLDKGCEGAEDDEGNDVTLAVRFLEEADR
jgi:hypothetical protein